MLIAKQVQATNLKAKLFRGFADPSRLLGVWQRFVS